MIAINTNYPNYEGARYYSYEQELKQKPEDVCDRLLDYLDCTKLNKDGIQLNKTTNLMYEEHCYKYIRHLFRITDFVVYNQYLDKLIARDTENREFESTYISPVKGKATKKKSNKAENKYIKTVTYDIFTNEEQYLYENLKTGDSIISKNPNLLDTLNNKPKKQKEVVQTITLKLKRTNLNIEGNVKT